MAITSLDGYIASSKQNISFVKTTARTSVAAMPFTTFDLAGQPGAGTLAGTSTTAGVVPTDATTGYPVVNSFAVGATGYISRVAYGSSVACRIGLYDRLFLSGAHTFSAADTLTSQPDYSGRLPNTDYKGTQLWIEAVTAFTGNPSIAITYTNQDGTTGRTTGTVATGVALTLGRMMQMPLQAGDTGIQKIESVTCTVATVGTFNVMVLRPLCEVRVPSAGAGGTLDMLSTGLPQIYDTSALFPIVTADSTSTGVPSLVVEVASA